MESDINEQRFNNLFQTSLEEIKAIIKVPSFSNGEVNEQYPYGKNVHQVLEDVIDLGKKLGFKTKLGIQNRYGYIEFGAGKELIKELIGILCHLDVVFPPGVIYQNENFLLLNQLLKMVFFMVGELLMIKGRPL
ncbi:hypothetical protein [Spiroplasma endosymbiont of Asaphidion curtum]|uniref:hypothetical protein n=1 Tax=Spiroplasma endosymbiont of Asaphidion curtum TaxID=3066281 RepID=UPI00313B0224